MIWNCILNIRMPMKVKIRNTRSGTCAKHQGFVSKLSFSVLLGKRWSSWHFFFVFFQHQHSASRKISNKLIHDGICIILHIKMITKHSKPKKQFRISINFLKKKKIFLFCRFASALGYYGLLLSTGEFPGNRHQILFISSLSELGAMICAFCALR